MSDDSGGSECCSRGDIEHVLQVLITSHSVNVIRCLKQ